jgi:hypothetical protein
MIISNNKLNYKEYYNYFDKELFLLNPIRKTINSKNDYPSIVWIPTFTYNTVTFNSVTSQSTKEELESLMMVYKMEDLTYNIDVENNIIESDFSSCVGKYSVYVNIEVSQLEEVLLDCVIQPTVTYGGNMVITKDLLLSEIMEEYPTADITIRALHVKPLLDDDIYDISIDGLPGAYEISLTTAPDSNVVSYFYFDNHTNHRKIIMNSYGTPLNGTNILSESLNNESPIVYNSTIFYNKIRADKPLDILQNTYVYPNSAIYYEKTTDKKILYNVKGRYITIDESQDPCRFQILQYDLRDSFEYEWERDYSEKYDLKEYIEGFSTSHTSENKQRQDFTSSRMREDINKSWSLDLEMKNEIDTEFKENIPYKIIYRRF